MIKIQNRGHLKSTWWLLFVIPIASAGFACLNNPCIHGICIDDINSFSTYLCYCIDGYTGVQCQTNWDECWSSPCQNGGTCIDGVATYNCSCPDGFIGDNCETNYNECDSNPCYNNGTCIDMTNEYVCHCIPGFSGDHCELDVAVCNSTGEIRCHNGGECIEGPGFKFYCKCSAGWTGQKCEDQIDECESNPCRNGGICIDAHADYMCACTYGYTGKSCEVAIEFCSQDSCSDKALCVLEDGLRVCYCVPDYHGERCELQYDECALGPRCLNGGTCIDGVDNFTCSCPPRLTGSLCECLILDDGNYDCEYIRPTLLPDHTTATPSYTDIVIIDTSTVESKYNTSTTTSLSTIDSGATIDITTTEIQIYTKLDNVTDIPITASSTDATVTESLRTSTEIYETSTDLLTSTSSSTSQLTTKEDSVTETVTILIETKGTLGTDDSKVETTECSGSCTKGNTSTSDLPTTIPSIETPEVTELITTTEMTKQTTDTTVDFKETTKQMRSDTTEYTHHAQDLTTEKMFTDSPVETTELTIESTNPMTEIEINTAHNEISTVHSDCTDVMCNNHGSCINTLHGVRCHCLFNYEGRFCETKIIVNSAAFDGTSYIAHHIKNSTSISITFKAKTLILDGEVMYVDIAKGAYMKLYMNSGLLRFEFSCGYQTMLLSELKTHVNRGYIMKIETRLDLFLSENHCNGTLRLNDTVAMSGGQFANISSPEYNSILYFGNKPYRNNSNEKSFIGCIKDLIINDERREIFSDAYEASEVRECSSLSCLSSPCVNGGTCHDDDDTYSCACANGWTGPTCNDSVCDHNPCQSGGSCVQHPGSGFLCLCPYGKHGIFCEYNVEITRPSLSPISPGKSSYVIYQMPQSAANSDRFEMRLRFQTSDMDQIALLAFVGQRGRHDARSQHLALTFVKGYIMLTWNMGAGPRRIFTSRPLGARRGGHTVRIWRRGRTAGLVVDGRYNVSGNAPAHTNNMTLLPYIYIGGHPSDDFRDLPHDLPLHSGWSGCVLEVTGQSGGRGVGGRGAGQCGVTQCTAKSCNAPRGVCIHSPATYGCICNEGWFGATCASPHSPCDRSHSRCQGACVITLTDAHCDCPYGKSGPRCDQELIPIDVLFTGARSYLKLKARSISSVSLALEAEIKPQKERGLIVFVETPHFYTSLSIQGGLLEYRWTDHLSGLTSLVRSGVVVSVSQWHGVRAGRYGNRLYVWVDGALNTEPMLAHAYPHTASGMRDLSELPFDVMSGPPESYSGCFRNFHLNNILLPLEQQNIEEGQNVLACEGSSCGARCRRAACSRDTCAGTCRRGRCVCPAGRAGVTCREHINITIPQFGGDAMLTLSGSDRREQLIEASPTRIKLNFNTADPNGLILWINTGIDYFGVGLENGYIKLSWSVHCNNSSGQTTKDYFPLPPKLTSTLVSAGFMADGEWHSIALTLRHNISLSIDEKLFVDQECYQIEDNDDTELFIGGVSEEDVIAKQLYPQNFKGCIDKISTKTDFYLTNYSEMHSENLKSCLLFPIVGT
ncbi:unnamed protein product [Danaus chrysippus]|uniref:(African queen) hypothetical protein n=1 Tax=Danaus chrysippus TaxID=151541 RepID=A0A8J2QPC6_9NEOP|nr:unnamed protein product [Danaus chrysippus]